MEIGIEVKVKKWGNSMGVILPKWVVEKEKLKENQKIRLSIIKETDLSDIFGVLKGKLKISAQKFKDEMRKEEELAEERKWKQLTS